MATLAPTLSSEDEEESRVEKKIARRKKTNDESSSEEDEPMNDFEFDGDANDTLVESFFNPTVVNWSFKSALSLLQANDNTGVERMNVASIIAAARFNLRKGHNEHDSLTAVANDNQHVSEDESSSSDEDEIEGVDNSNEMETDVLTERQNSTTPINTDSPNAENSEDEERMEDKKKEDYFESTKTTASFTRGAVQQFNQLSLSRPLLRGVASIGYTVPTPIQSQVIPTVLAGRDVCASAVTGSGKTAAFLLPMLERILLRGSGGATKGLILTPTRELAAQCVGMMYALAKYTNLTSCLIVGGAKNVLAQAAELRNRPDLIIATPGRLLDHITNSSGVHVDDIEFLVLDEADRLLDLGFQDEIHEIVKSCPKERQTLLFSATLSTKVEELVKLSLKHPVRVRISDHNESNDGIEVAHRLEQEFVRIRPGNEGVNRQAMLLALITRTFTQRIIVFFDTKVEAHTMMIICGLCGIKCAELHGNLTQVQRLEALESFREGKDVNVLLATDLAARGLDIERVEMVINFEMPNLVDTYVHRIGRTARAGRRGTSCTLIGESRRHLMKDVIRDAEEKKRKGLSELSGVIRSRTIPQAVVTHFVTKINSLEPHVQQVLEAEAVAKMDRVAEMEAVKVKNIIEHQEEIRNRPIKNWFTATSTKQTKEEALEKRRNIAGTGTHRMTRKKRRNREAQQELLQAQEESRQQQQQSDDGEPKKTNKKKKVVTEKSIKTSARAHKKQQEVNKKEKDGMSLHDESVVHQQQQKKKRRKVVPSDALGDASLFEEERVIHSTKKKIEEHVVRPSAYKFRGHDPSKDPSKKGDKKSVKKFKSKSKFKRKK